MSRDFSMVRTIVVKIGSNLLSDKSGIDRKRIEAVVSDIAALKAKGLQVLLVS